MKAKFCLEEVDNVGSELFPTVGESSNSLLPAVVGRVGSSCLSGEDSASASSSAVVMQEFSSLIS